MTAPQLVWLRQDLRLADQPAFAAAAEAGPTVACYVLDDDCNEEYGRRRLTLVEHEHHTRGISLISQKLL